MTRTVRLGPGDHAAVVYTRQTKWEVGGGATSLKALRSSGFFFQAEDGIRDVAVTGVQTCALPISGRARIPRDPRPRGGAVGRPGEAARRALARRAGRADGRRRPGRSRAHRPGTQREDRKSVV